MAEWKIITSASCGYCVMAKKLLQKEGIEYTEADVIDEMDTMSEYRLKTVPQIFKDGTLIPGGYTGLKEYFKGN